MMLRLVAVLLCVALAACAVTPSPDTARVPLDNDVAAANQAAWAFAAPERTANDPVDAARAAAGVDFLAGELSSNPRWLMVSPLTKQEMLAARRDVRAALGIAPVVPSQVVVTALLRFAAEWQDGNPTGAMPALAAAGFAMTPEQMLQRLTAMPFIRSANVASMEAANPMLPSGDMATAHR